ncbi:MAG: sialate O-acetylesterase [Sedimentisphaerales bacterium]|nr:sialate O-acetylesterase [Sedimentisphaerales bacterium]
MKKLGLFVMKAALLTLILLLLSTTVLADVTLPHIISSGMVLQRQAPVPIWGWANPDEQITLTFAGKTFVTKAIKNGTWKLTLRPLEAGGPYEMTIKAKNEILLTDVLVGEVWFCSGQSNMEMGIGVVKDAEKEIAAANYPKIRLFDVPKKPSAQPASDVDAVWRTCSPENIKKGGREGFSAVAYFFGREIHNNLDIPVALIDASWGGSYIEPWTPPEAFEAEPELAPIVEKIKSLNAEYRKNLADSLDPLQVWIQKTKKALAENKKFLPEQPDFPQHPFTKNEPYEYPWQPTGLFNGMVYPVIPFAVKGAIWYQGESNLIDGMLYHKKMKALITGWRKRWKNDDMPFYFVQIAPFRYENWPDKNVTPYSLPQLWQAQLKSLSIPNTGMAVTTDITELDDIHPRNKQDVGKRLALWALAKTYGKEDIVYSGPLYKSMAVEGDKIRISFGHTGSGLASRDGQTLAWFEIAGADKKFQKANAKIDGDTVLVSNEQITAPVAVRFAWHQEAIPNLMNKEGLPASPFTTELQ